MASHGRDDRGSQAGDRFTAPAFPMAPCVRPFVAALFHAVPLPPEPAVPCGVVRAVLMGSLRGPDMMALQIIWPRWPVLAQEALGPENITVPPDRQHRLGRHALLGMRGHQVLDDREAFPGRQQDQLVAAVLPMPPGAHTIGGRTRPIPVFLAALVADYRHGLGSQAELGGEGGTQTYPPVTPPLVYKETQAARTAIALTLVQQLRQEGQVGGAAKVQELPLTGSGR